MRRFCTRARSSSATPTSTMVARLKVMSGTPPGSGTVPYRVAIGASAIQTSIATRGRAIVSAANTTPATAAGTYIQVSVRTATVAIAAIASAGIQLLGFIDWS
jgi:hypothetical protein